VSFFGAPSSDTSLIALLAIIVLQAVVVFVLLKISLTETKKMCDDGGLGAKIVGLVALVAGIAKVAATGGIGVGLRESLGNVASRADKKMTESGRGTSAGGKLVLKTLRKVGDARYGTKENYASRQERGKQKHESYMKTLSKEKNFVSKDKNGNVIMDKNNKPEMISAQQQYINNLRNQNILQSMMKGRVGTKRFVSEQGNISQEKRNLLSSNKKLSEAKESYEQYKDKVKTGRLVDRPNARIQKREKINKAQEEENKIKEENKKAEEKRKKEREKMTSEKKINR